MPINKCIRVAESEQPAKIDYLRKSNFLSEFSTALDKAKVRQILGIPESASFFWQDLQGLPQKNPELVNYITNKLLPINNRINDLQTTINGLSESYQEIIGLLSGVESIGDLVSSLQSLERRVTDAETDINHNSALIRLIGSGGGSADLSDLRTLVDNLRREVLSKISQETLTTVLLTYAKTSDLSNVRNTIDELTSRISTLEDKLAENILKLIRVSPASLSKTCNGETQSATINVYAEYTKQLPRDITNSTNLVVQSNNNAISWIGGQTNNLQIVENVLQETEVDLTFTYSEEGTHKETHATITVIPKQEEIPTINDIFYIGYASGVTEIFTGTTYQKTQLNDITWNSENIPKQFPTISQGSSVIFYVGVPVKYTNVVITSAGLPAGTKMNNTQTANNVLYNVWKINGIIDYNSEFLINVS